MLYAGDAGIISRHEEGLKKIARLNIIFVDVRKAFGVTMSETNTYVGKKGARDPGQDQRPEAHLGNWGCVADISNGSVEISRRAHLAWLLRHVSIYPAYLQLTKHGAGLHVRPR